MILRLSQKLGKKVKESPTKVLPLDPSPFADWSGHLFTADRTQYIIITNTVSLYSTIMYGKGIAHGFQLLDYGFGALREYMQHDGLAFIYMTFVVPTMVRVRFSKAINRSITGSMNELVFHAKMWILDGGLSPFDAAIKINEMPMSALGEGNKYGFPRDAFKALLDETSVCDNEATPFDELKTVLTRKLTEKLDLSKVTHLNEDVLHREVRTVVEHLCDTENPLLGRMERQRLIDEVFDDLFGLGPLEPRS